VGRIVAGRSAVQYKALMPDYCFRIRFRLAERLNINSPAHDIPIADPVYGKEVVLKSAESEKPIAEAKHLALIAKSYDSEQQATAAGEWWKAVLQKAFSRVLVGADFGARGRSDQHDHGGWETLVQGAVWRPSRPAYRQ
jgi:hypothetical protein